MKKFILTLTLTLSVVFIYGQWETQLQHAGTYKLDRIFFLNENLGWITGGNYAEQKSPLYFTNDGGLNWVVNDSIEGDDVLFLNPDTGFVVHQNHIYRTNNGGNSWLPTQSPSVSFLKLYFPNYENGWAISSMMYRELLHTTDNGISWQYQSYQTVFETAYDVIFFVNDSIGFICGAEGGEQDIRFATIRKTSNAGIDWPLIYAVQDFSLVFSDVYFTSSMNGWFIGTRNGCAYVLHTNDGGQTMEEQFLPGVSNYSKALCVYFVNDSIGWIGVGSFYGYTYGAIYLTTDGGLNWDLQQEFPQSIFDIQMIDQHTGWAVGGDYIYHTNIGDSLLWVNVDENSIENEVFTVSPNPFNDVLHLHIPNDYTVNEISILNIVGKNYFKYTGIKETTINLGQLQKGIYLISIQYSNNNQLHNFTKKIVKF